MTHCPRCGRNIPEHLPICPACGAVIAGGSSPAEIEDRVEQLKESVESEAMAAAVEISPIVSTGAQEGEDPALTAERRAQLLTTPPVAAPTQAATVTKYLAPIIGRIGAAIATLGSIMAFIACFMPWFLVMVVTTSFCGSTETTTAEVSPLGVAQPFDSRVFVIYVVLVTILLVLSLIVFIRRATRKVLWAGVTHLVVSFLGLLNLLLAIPPSNSNVTIVKVLSGFWVGLSGLITSLIGSFWMLIDMLIDIMRAPKE